MQRVRRWIISVAAIALLALVSACGGGGGDTAPAGSPSLPPGSPPLPPKILSWSPPSAYTDNTPLNPVSELDSFEVYVNTSGSFSNADTPLAYVQAVDPVSHQLNTEFNLANLGPYLSKGIVYYVSLRATALTGARSDFSPAASFSF